MIEQTDRRIFIDKAGLSIDYRTAIGIGALAGHTTFRGCGSRTALATTVGGDDIWEVAAAAMVFPDQTSGERLSIVSTSANDAAAGSGARTLMMSYLDSGGNPAAEVITLNGTTPVHTVATNIRFVQFLSVASVSALGVNTAGDISVYRFGDAARVYNIIKAGTNSSKSSAKMVPAGVNFYLTGIKAEATDNKPISIRLRATCDVQGILVPNVFMCIESFDLYNSSQTSAIQIVRKIPSLSIIKATALSTTAGGIASISYDGWLE